MLPRRRLWWCARVREGAEEVVRGEHRKKKKTLVVLCVYISGRLAGRRVVAEQRLLTLTHHPVISSLWIWLIHCVHWSTRLHSEHTEDTLLQLSHCSWLSQQMSTWRQCRLYYPTWELSWFASHVYQLALSALSLLYWTFVSCLTSLSVSG